MTRYKLWTSKYFRIIIGCCLLGFVLFCTSFVSNLLYFNKTIYSKAFFNNYK